MKGEMFSLSTISSLLRDIPLQIPHRFRCLQRKIRYMLPEVEFLTS